MQRGEARGAGRRETLFRRLVRFPLAQGVGRGQQHPAQQREAGFPGRRGQGFAQRRRVALVGRQLAHFEQSEIRLHVVRPARAEEPGQRLARLARAEPFAQRVDHAPGERRPVLPGRRAQRQPFAAAIVRPPHQPAHRLQSGGVEQRDESARRLAFGMPRQFGGERLPQLVEQTRIEFRQRRAGQIGRQRRRIDELQEPAVKGIHRQRRLRRQDVLIERAGRAQGRLVRIHPALGEERRHLRLAARRQQPQPVDHALLDLARRLAREGDRQDRAGRHAGQQQPHDARRQQPRLAAPGARLDDDAAGRIKRLGGQLGNGRGRHPSFTAANSFISNTDMDGLRPA